jgi:hypothetical protein
MKDLRAIVTVAALGERRINFVPTVIDRRYNKFKLRILARFYVLKNCRARYHS